MSDPASPPPATTAALRAIEADHPRWHTWVGVAGLLYARVPKSSPPIVVRATTPEQLRAAVEAAEAKRRQR